MSERIDIQMEGGITTRKVVRIYGETLKKPNGKPRYFRTETAARKAAEKVIKARRAHIGE